MPPVCRLERSSHFQSSEVVLSSLASGNFSSPLNSAVSSYFQSWLLQLLKLLQANFRQPCLSSPNQIGLIAKVDHFCPYLLFDLPAHLPHALLKSDMNHRGMPSMAPHAYSAKLDSVPLTDEVCLIFDRDDFRPFQKISYAIGPRKLAPQKS